MNSMTGFGVARGKVGRSHIVVEARSVNHRFCEVSLRFPGRFAGLEPDTTRLVRELFARGKFEMFLREELIESEETEIALAQRAHQVLKKIQKQLNLEGRVTLSDLLTFRGIFFAHAPQEKGIDSTRRPLLHLVQQALSGLLQMRRREGERLQKWFQTRALSLERLLVRIQRHSLRGEKDCRRRLEVKLKNRTPLIEEERLAQEAALMAGRADVMEEIVRLRSHLEEFRRLLREKGPVGRRIDFLTQEMGREINTIGSKSQGVRLTHEVIEFKSDLERIKEQIQNVE